MSFNLTKVTIINPKNNSPLKYTDNGLVDTLEIFFQLLKEFHIELENYTKNFGMQWNKFDKT